MITMKTITGMMNTGKTITGVTAIGPITRMGTTVSIMFGGIHGGGIRIGGGAIGIITSIGGMTVVVGGSDRAMVAG
jgi:hypothetical protein